MLKANTEKTQTQQEAEPRGASHRENLHIKLHLVLSQCVYMTLKKYEKYMKCTKM